MFLPNAKQPRPKQTRRLLVKLTTFIQGGEEETRLEPPPFDSLRSLRTFDSCQASRPVVSERSESNGGGEIRTHETLAGLPVFKTGAFDHSATPPGCLFDLISHLIWRQIQRVFWHFTGIMRFNPSMGRSGQIRISLCLGLVYCHARRPNAVSS
jgi:hypothetical protein